EVDEVREDEARVRFAHEVDRLAHAVGIRLGPDLLVDADAIEDVGDLPEADHTPAVLRCALDDRLARRLHREILAIRGALEGALPRTDERARDDAADVVLAPHQLARHGTDAPELF